MFSIERIFNLMSRSYFLVSIIFFLSISSFAQRPDCSSEIDSILAKGHKLVFSQTDSSFQYFEKANQMSLSCSDSLGIVKSVNFLGLYNYLKNNYEIASNYYFEALEISEKKGYQKDEGIAHNNLGALSFDIQQFSNSKEHYEQALDIMITLQDTSWISRIYGNIAGVYFMNEEYDKSVATLNLSIDLAILAQNYVAVGGALSNLAMVHMTLQDDQAAFSAYDRGAHLLDSVGDKRGVCITLQEKADALLHHNKLDQAKIAYLDVLKRAQTISHKESIVKSYKGLFEIEEKSGNSSEALTYHKLYSQWKDSLLNEEKIRSINELNQKYKTEQKEKEIRFLTTEAELKDQLVEKNQREKTYITLTAILFFVVIILIAIQLRQKQRLNRELTHKNTIIEEALLERELLIKEVHHRVKNNLQIVSSMLNIQANAIQNKEVKDAILESRKRVQSMSIVHQKLYKSDKIGSINIKEYLQFVLAEVESFYEYDETVNIEIFTEIQDIELSIDTTIHLGLITTELVSNCFKHAFAGMSHGKIDVKLSQENEDYALSVCDNGIGFDSLNFHKSESFGTKLIKSLSKGLSANPEWKNDNGTKVHLIFKA